MSNKTLGGWLLGTLLAGLFIYVMGEEDFAGVIIVANWVFVIIASIRLMSKKLADITLTD